LYSIFQNTVGAMPATKWIIIVAVVLFVGYVLYDTTTAAEISCEVCLEFDGRMVCRMGAGRTEEAALTAAQESTCGGNAQGMSELIECRNRVPERAQCTGG
jgi:hypothetical protein